MMLTMSSRIVQGLSDLNSRCVQFQLPSSKCTEEFLAFIGSLPQSKLTNYDRFYADGYWKCVVDFWYAHHLEYCYVKNGVMYSTHRGTSPNTDEFYSSGRGQELGELPSGHFWKGGSRKLFFTNDKDPKNAPLLEV